MRVLIASVTNREPEVVRPHLDSLKGLEIPKDVEVDLAYIVDAPPDETVKMLSEAGARLALAEPKPIEARYAVTEQTHEWNLPTFGWLANEKQKLLDLAVDEDYDYIFFVDSDLVLGPETLRSLLACGKEIVSAVFWTSWQRDSPPMPQVWLTHPYDFGGRSGEIHLEPHEFLKRLDHRELVEVGGLGACTLIRTSVLDRVRYFPLLDGLPLGGMWQGEDRSFCIRASRAHVSLWADSWPDIHHAYRPSDVRRYQELVDYWPETKEIASFGDLVSFSLEPLEEPELAGWKAHLRGRFGTFKILPEIEDALLNTKVGEERLLKVTFPGWWETEHMRGKTTSLLLRVVDVKATGP